jgi:hypothetical protein
MHLEEDLLHDVFCVGVRPEHPEDEASHVAPVAAKQLGERGPIPALSATDYIVHLVRLAHTCQPSYLGLSPREQP